MPIRKNLAVSRDPYFDRKGQKEVAICKKCGALYRHKRWSFDDPMATKPGLEYRKVICPACRKIRDGFPGGIITLRGGFMRARGDQILRLVHNEGTRAKRINPMERIISVRKGRDRVEIQTTSERFAQRIGREIQRAYKGTVAYRWSKVNKFMRVDWYREGES